MLFSHAHVQGSLFDYSTFIYLLLFYKAIKSIIFSNRAVVFNPKVLVF